MKNLHTFVLTFLLAIFTVQAVPLAYAAVTQKFVQTPTITLYSSISSSATSMRIVPYPKDLSGTKLTMTDLGSTPTVTIDPKIKNYEEIVSFTGITDNGDNTATLTGLTRGLLSKYPYTSGGTAYPHAASAIVVFSNNPQIYGRLASKENDETVTGAWTFNTRPVIPSDTDTTVPTAFVTFGQLARQAISGAANSSETINGIAQLATTIQAASTTSTGSTGARLVLPASMATSSNDVAGLHVVITQNSGKINWNQIDLGTAFTSTGGFTSTATTTVSASSLTTNPFVINTLAYKFPSSRGAAGTTFTEDGAGTLTMSIPAGAAYTFATTTATTVANGYATSSALSIPAGFITASSSILVTGQFTCAVGASSSGDTCDVSLKDTTGASATLVSHTGFTTIDNGNATYTGTFTAQVFMNNSLASEKAQIICTYYSVGAAFVAGKFTACGDSASASQNWANTFSLAAVIHSTTNTTVSLTSLFIKVTR